MSTTYSPGRMNFGLLPEPEGRSASFITSAIVNGMILAIVLIVGMTAKHVLQEHKYEMTELIIPSTPPPPIKVKPPVLPKMPPPPTPPKVQLDRPKIDMPKPKPEPKPVQLEAKMTMPEMKPAKPAIILAPQPKAALAAAMPAQNNTVKASTAPVHLGETFGVTPNPNANKPATIAAIGNPYGGMQGPAVAPHGVVGSAGIGNGLKSGSNAGTVGKVASAGIPGATGTSNSNYGKVASAGIPTQTAAAITPIKAVTQPAATSVEVLSKPPVQYTSEARQLHVQGDVVLRVTFMATGQVIVQGVLQGLGHGLDEEARRVASQIRFRPATKDGRAVDLTTNIRITFQLA
ncbi:MAG TPA: energy transducer TonB [Terracidiphilus sp.]|jgi:TonB family protein|nr:energy transducer TonB [Terracidiphilus sp.]